MEPQWIKWVRALQSIAQTGLHFATNEYDIERYKALQVIAAEILAHQSDLDQKLALSLFNREFGYATPKVDVRGVIFQDGKILLVREVMDGDLWSLPGGWADINESPSESVVREVYEESGYQTIARRLLAVYDRCKQPDMPPFPYHVYKLFFLCEIVGGTAQPSYETSEVAFFGEAELPALSQARVTAQQIYRFFACLHNQDWLTDFD